MYKNSEGHSSTTEGAAISNIMREYRKEQKRRYADKNRKKVYVASQYAGDVKNNMKAAAKYCRHVIRKGYMPIAAHLMYPAILDDNDPAQRELGMLFGLSLLGVCDEVWVFGPVSTGMEQEIREANKLHIPVKFIKEAGA